jgi:hypothetical protein
MSKHKIKNHELTDDDAVPATDDFEAIRRNLGAAVRGIDLTTGGAEGDLAGAAVAGAEGTIEGAGDWGGQPGVPGTEFPERDVDSLGHPERLQVRDMARETD